MYMYAYLTQSDYDHLRDPRMDISVKYRILAQRCIKLGLVSPTEHTVVNLLCTVLAVIHEGGVDVSGNEALAFLKDFKLIFKHLKHKSTYVTGPISYPRNPHEFRDSHQDPPSYCSDR